MAIERMGFEKNKRITFNYGNRHTYNGCLLKSDAEYSFALLLDAIKECGRIVSWQYEPKTFWFDNIKRGTVSYKPDFLATWDNGNETWYEVKRGRVTQKDITKWRRMSLNYPDVLLVLTLPSEPKTGKLRTMIDKGEKYLHHVWYVGEDYKKFGIPTKF